MASRPQPRRPKDFKPGRVMREPPDLALVADRIRYVPDGKHKSHPAPNGEWTYVWNSEGTKCHPIRPEDWPRVTDLLRQAVRVGSISEQFRGEFPARAWAYVNGTLHEARWSGNGEYHAFPLDYEEQHPADPDARLHNAPRLDLE